MFKEISAQTLKQMMDNRETFQLVDIRENHERDACHIGGDHIPMGQIGHRLMELRKDVPLVIYCQHGSRSGYLCEALAQAGFTNTVNLLGGIASWAQHMDPTIRK